MLDWNRCRQQIADAIAQFGKLGPDRVRGDAALGNAGAALICSARVMDACTVRTE